MSIILFFHQFMQAIAPALCFIMFYIIHNIFYPPDFIIYIIYISSLVFTFVRINLKICLVNSKIFNQEASHE